MQHRLKTFLPIFWALIAIAGATQPVRADEWPARPVTIVVPYAPGGNTDFLARLSAEHLRKAFNKPFLVENRAGAGGTIAAEYVARAPADGYTLLMGTVTQISLAPFLYTIKYDPVKDFVPIAKVGSNPLVITVSAQKPFSTLADFVKFGKENPGKLNVSHAGVGSLSHISAALFLYRAGIKATMVSYKGGAPALTDLMGGQVDMYSANISEIMPHAKSGKIRFLAVSSETPIKQLPGVPTIASTYPGHVVETWNGILGPANMPQPAVDRIASEFQKIAASPDFQAKLTDAGVTPRQEVKNEFAQSIRNEVGAWKSAIEQADIKLE